MNTMMRQVLTTLAMTLISLVPVPAAHAQDCHNIDVQGDQAFGMVTNQRIGACNTQLKNGFPVPDPRCTPVAFNPTVTLDILQDPNYHTRCNRDRATAPQEKFETYSWYRLHDLNRNDNQVCELDHFVPLELGGADTLDNIRLQCGPNEVALNERYFKLKDMVENYLTALVKAGKMDLDEARKGISSDWTQYLEAAKRACQGDRCSV
jgi:hypothetical protein